MKTNKNLTIIVSLFFFFLSNFWLKASIVERKYSQENDIVKYHSKGDFNRTFYIDAIRGDDNNSGLSIDKALKTLKVLESKNLTSGDEILLCGGQNHKGTIELIDINPGEDKDKSIHIGSYGKSKATLDFSGYPSGVLIRNSSNIIITDLKITADGSGVKGEPMLRLKDINTRDRIGVQIVNSWYDASKSSPESRNMYNITISNIDFYDIFYYNKDDDNIPNNRPCRSWSEPSKNYGYAIKGHNQAQASKVENILVEDCRVRNVSNMGVQITGNGESIFNNVKFTSCNFDKTGGPGYMFANCNNVILEKSRTYCSGSFDDVRKWGRGSGIWMMNCDGFLLDKNHFEGASGIGDSCGAHIDHGNRNVIVQYCFSRNNAGGFVEVLGKNRNCSYRYNISYDDGWRNTQKNDARQNAKYWAGTTALTLGALITINGYTGHEFIGPYQTYIYNNTIINSKERPDGYINPFVFQIATSCVGVLVANNIFYVPQQMSQGWSQHTTEKNGIKKIDEKAFDFRKTYKKGDDFVVRDMTQEEIDAMDIVIANNLYKTYDPTFAYAENALPNTKNIKGVQMGYIDNKALGGNPEFMNPEGENAQDFVPRNKTVVERGVKIEKLKSDKTSYGLSTLSSDKSEGTSLGLELKYDFFDRPITTPIVGACRPQSL